MDPTYPEIDSTQFPIMSVVRMLWDVEESILPNALEVIGKAIFACLLIVIMQEIRIHVDLVPGFS